MRADIRRGVAAAVRLAQGESVRDVLDVRDPRAWLGLDTGVRADEFFCPPGVVQWDRMAGARELTDVLRGPGPLTESQLALALCHRDGRIRQAALDRTAGYPVLLPVVVLRCAEWAPPVRDRARQRLAEGLDALTAVSLAPMILLVGRRNRADFAVGLLDETLRRAPATGSSRSAPARAVAGLRVLDVADVRRLRPLVDDPAAGVVREVTAAQLPSAELVPEEWLTERLGARWPRPVQVAAFRLLDARGGSVRRRAAEALSDDPDVKLRGWAERAVKQG
ncbi:hypothetical protein [Streptomyces sp. STR69]|uniref:hypothetical protein n=1 Tax=Streptomyces sp. STR69 TaxID=1796942 RepID=UPI0021C8215F|nr:hypothetical protein [Streptomyces sp. STR69]